MARKKNKYQKQSLDSKSAMLIVIATGIVMIAITIGKAVIENIGFFVAIAIIATFTYIMTIFAKRSHANKVQQTALLRQNQLIGLALDLIIQDTVQLGIERLKVRRRDEYGIPRYDNWDTKRAYYYNKVLIPKINEISNYFETPEIRSAIESAIDEAAISQEQNGQESFAFSSEMNGIEYEKFCATILEQHNWQVKTTPKSGDQGIDLIHCCPKRFFPDFPRTHAFDGIRLNRFALI